MKISMVVQLAQLQQAQLKAYVNVNLYSASSQKAPLMCLTKVVKNYVAPSPFASYI